MSDLIDKIKASQPTHLGESAMNMMLEVFSNQDFAIVSSSLVGMPMAEAVATTFIDSIAAADLPGQGTLKIYHPLYIGHWVDEPGTGLMWILYYGNGHVVYVEDHAEKESYLYVLIHKDILDILQIPVDTANTIAQKMKEYIESMPDQ